jgi:hypothetical protein
LLIFVGRFGFNLVDAITTFVSLIVVSLPTACVAEIGKLLPAVRASP